METINRHLFWLFEECFWGFDWRTVRNRSLTTCHSGHIFIKQNQTVLNRRFLHTSHGSVLTQFGPTKINIQLRNNTEIQCSTFYNISRAAIWYNKLTYYIINTIPEDKAYIFVLRCIFSIIDVKLREIFKVLLKKY